MKYHPQACKWILASMLIFFQPAAVAGVYHYPDSVTSNPANSPESL